MKGLFAAALAGIGVLVPVAAVSRGDQRGDVAIQVSKGHIDFLAGGELAGRYHYEDQWSRAKPIFWPLQAPGGTPLTRGWPMTAAGPGGSTDHPHQKSAWFCHGDVIPEGIALKHKIRGVDGVDFWSEAPGHGRIVCTSVGRASVKGGSGAVPTQNEWRTADGTKILDEDRRLLLVNGAKARLFILEIELTASVCPITFGDTKEGAMGVRVNDALREQRGTGKLQNAEGKKGEAGTWGRRSAWCDYSGKVDGNEVGIALLNDPHNRPCCWHSRGYGLLAANPFGRDRSRFPDVRGQTELVRLAKGERLRLRYGILLHAGNAATADVGGQFRHFVELRSQR